MRNLIPSVLAGPALLALGAAAPAQFAFDPAADYAAAVEPEKAALADLNGDSAPDMAVAVDAPDRILVFLNNGDGSFGAPTAIFVGNGVSPHTVVAYDQEGDGDLDLAVTLQDQNQVQTWINNGSGVFSAGGSFGTGVEPRNIVAGRLNADMLDDLVTANRDGGTVSVLLNDGLGGFSAATTYAAGTETRGVAVGHFDGDASLDLVASSHDTRELIVRFNDGSGGFAASTSLSVGPQLRPEGVTAADLDGDGDDDVAASTSDNGFDFVSVFLATGTGTFSGPSNVAINGSDPGHVVAADLDLDGDLDLATANQDSNNASLMENLGGGVFAAGQNLPAGTEPDGISVADLDGNGSPDLAVSNKLSNTVSVYLNQEAGGLKLAPADPGMAGVVNTLTVTGATPLGTVQIAASIVINGTTAIPACPGLFWDLRKAKIVGTPTADASGTATTSKMVPPRFAGRTIYIQALDESTCTLSNRVEQIF